MKSSNLAYRMDREAEVETGLAPVTSARERVETSAAERRAREKASFDYRAIVIRDQGFRPFRVR